MPLKTLYLYLSDDAVAFLKRQAKDYSYISRHAHNNSRGFGDYIVALASCKFIDTRPYDVKQMDMPLLESGELPEWSLSLQRKPVLVKVTDDAVAKLRETALHFGITNKLRADSADLKYSPVSAMLEAVGIGWLSPVDMPVCTHPPKGRARYKKEYIW